MAEMRLIDADALIKGFEDAGLGDHSLIESVLAAGVYAGIENPTIDAVPVVRCRECKYSRPLTKGLVACLLWNRAFPCDGFCHEGEKMDGGAEG